MHNSSKVCQSQRKSFIHNIVYTHTHTLFIHIHADAQQFKWCANPRGSHNNALERWLQAETPEKVPFRLFAHAESDTCKNYILCIHVFNCKKWYLHKQNLARVYCVQIHYFLSVFLDTLVKIFINIIGIAIFINAYMQSSEWRSIISLSSAGYSQRKKAIVR